MTLARAAAALLLVVLAAPLAWQVVSGDAYLTIEGRSMMPTYAVGDLLVVQQPTGRELTRPGQVVVVGFGAGGDGMYVHRVVEPLPDGSAWLQGDGNDERDPRPVTQDAVRGTPRLVLAGPAAGALAFTQSPAGRVVLGGAALGLLLLPRGRRGTAGSDADEAATVPVSSGGGTSAAAREHA